MYTFSGTSVYGFINGTVRCNEKLASLTDITRPLLRDSVEAVNKVYFKFIFFMRWKEKVSDFQQFNFCYFIVNSQAAL